jgi:hypothetical protein
MLKFDNFSSANDLAQNAASDRDRLLVQLLTTMTDRIVQLEARLDKLSDLTVGDEMAPFAYRVLAVIEDSSYTAFTHIEAEIDEKLSDFIDSYSFTEAVAEAASDGLTGRIKEVLDDELHDAIIDAIGDPEDIVRKGLRSIL